MCESERASERERETEREREHLSFMECRYLRYLTRSCVRRQGCIKRNFDWKYKATSVDCVRFGCLQCRCAGFYLEFRWKIFRKFFEYIVGMKNNRGYKIWYVNGELFFSLVNYTLYRASLTGIFSFLYSCNEINIFNVFYPKGCFYFKIICAYAQNINSLFPPPPIYKKKPVHEFRNKG